MPCCLNENNQAQHNGQYRVNKIEQAFGLNKYSDGYYRTSDGICKSVCFDLQEQPELVYAGRLSGIQIGRSCGRLYKREKERERWMHIVVHNV